MNIVEIFQSIEGEVSGHGQGRITTFIRFAGCNLSCDYCDTPESQTITNAQKLSPGEILYDPLVVKSDNITITGGEPLLQEDDFYSLLYSLFNMNKKITVETNGTISPKIKLSSYSPNVSWVVDFKLHALMNFPFTKLSSFDFIKFVVSSKDEFLKAAAHAKNYNKWSKARIAFSAVLNSELPSAQVLYDWIIQEKLYFVIVNVQIHKLCGLK